MYRHLYISDVFASLRQTKALLIVFVVVMALFVGIFSLQITVNAQSAASSFQPTRSSIYGTFYYPWYKNQTVDGTWSYWQDNNYSPPNSWFSNYLPLRPGALDSATGTIHPAAGLYSSRDKDAFYWQLNAMATAKLEVAISSWWGQSASATNDNAGPNAIEGKSDFTFRKIVSDWMNQADNPYPNLRWTIYYEKEGGANPTVAEIAADLIYINNNYANQPAFFKVNGRPVIFAYGGVGDACTMVDRWLQARAQSGVNFYLVLKLFSGYTSCASQPDSWHEYAPAARSGTYSTYSSFISPGFWKVGDTTARLARNLTEFDAAAAAMVSANTKWKLVQTWNEWGEGTSVEPGVQVQQTTSGTASLASNGAPFEDKYIQVLSQRLPSLQAGTGASGTQAATPTPVPTSVAAKTATPVPTAVTTATPTSMPTVFIILMENHNWNQIKGSASAPYINSLLTQGAHAEAYFNPPGLHPSEPNYLWLEAGTNFGITNDDNPSSNHQSSTQHLTTLLGAANISWKSYQEDIAGTVCPLTSTGLYAPKHNPMVFFDDVTGVNNPQSANCIAHVRPYTELATDLTGGNVAKYNFITPNLCNDMHNSSGCATTDSVKNGDNWLKQAIPSILASNAYKNGGIVFITWDEGEGGDGPIGMIVLSSNAKISYSNTIHYTHSSTLRTLQEIFGVKPFLGDAANASDLSDLFTTFPGATPPNNTAVPPTATKTSVPPTATKTVVPPTFTATATVAPPTATKTTVPPTATVVPTKTSTVAATVPPTATKTVVPPTFTATATVVPPSSTPVAPTLTFTSIPPTVPPTPNGPALTVEMNPVSAAVGTTVSAVLKLNNMSNLYGLQTKCKVDPNVLAGTGHSEGNIFTSSNSFIVDEGYQSDGTWSVAGSLLNPAPAFNGSGTAFSLNYKVLNVGHTSVECTALAVDANGNLLPMSVVNSGFDGTQGAPATAVPTVVPPTFTPAPPTATPLPTFTPTLAATLTAVPGTITGVVKYEKHPDQTGIAITILSGGTTVAQGQSTADGSFQFVNVPAGQYVVKFSAPGYLSASANIDVQAGQGATVQATLMAGDIDNNGVVDLADAGLIGANYRVQAPPAPTQADLDRDGSINLVDLVLVGKNFGKTAQ